MVKTVIKLDGSEEPFQAEKAAKWAEYAGTGLSKHVDWPSIVIDAVNESPPVIKTQDFQLKLIDATLRRESWSHYLMAGRLYAPYLHKKVHGASIPTVKELHIKLSLLGFMERLNYTEEDYAFAESLIDHERDKTYPYFRLDYIYKKYGIQDRVNGNRFETPQFTYMRMAMALAEEFPADIRHTHIRNWYNFLSKGKLNAPTPNFVNLGTPLRGYASCCIYSTADNAPSIGAGLQIAYTMTYMSAGVGTHLATRSIGDPVRGGSIEHQGKLPYIRATKAMVDSNLQNGRGGAATLTWNGFDPEANVIAMLSNPMSPEEKKIRGIDYSMTYNRFMARKVGRKEKMFTFNCYTAPDLYEAFYSGDPALFEEIYLKYEADDSFHKEYVDARELMLTVLEQGYETGRYYTTNGDEMNRHTPFKDTVHASNLCQEIMLPQVPYDKPEDLYSPGPVGFIKFVDVTDGVIHLSASSPVAVDRGDVIVIPAIQLEKGEKYQAIEHHFSGQVKEIIETKVEPEVAMCNIGAICVSEVESDHEYELLAYYALLMVDICIHKAHYELPHVGYTSKARMNAGIGIMGLATWMAKNGHKYTELEGKKAMHALFETHYYHLMKASIKLGRERGNAPWIHRTKYPEGYLIFDSANPNQEELHERTSLKRNWSEIRSDLVQYGGGRFSCVVAHMPGESSSKASGQPNSLYPPRELVHSKSDNGIRTMFAVPEGDIIGDKYQIAWDLPAIDQIAIYAIAQKFCDQGISADFWRRLPEGEKIGSKEMLGDFAAKVKYGLKSTYYQNTLTSKAKELADGTTTIVDVLNTENPEYAGPVCFEGVCSM